jgi:hypothetical protein
MFKNLKREIIPCYKRCDSLFYSQIVSLFRCELAGQVSVRLTQIECGR